MLKKASSIIPFTLSLPQIVKKVLQTNTPFEELWYSDKTRVLQYIKKHNLDVRVLLERGFDILKKTFFVFEYELINEECKKSRKDFPDFKSFYQYVRGEIYERSCYYGYSFSKKEIFRYRIHPKQVNYNGFVQKQFRDCKERQEEQTQRQTVMAAALDQIDRWMQKRPKIYKSLKKLLSDCHSFELLYNKNRSGCYKAEDVFFSLLFQKEKDCLKEVLPYVFLSSNPPCSIKRLISGASIHYGEKETNALLQECNSIALKTSNLRFLESVKQLTNQIDQILVTSNHIVKRGFFSKSDNLFCVSYDIYQDLLLIHCGVYTDFFLSFEDFVQALDHDLSNCDLKDAFISEETRAKYEKDLASCNYTPFKYASCVLKKLYSDSKFFVTVSYYNSNGTLVESEQKQSFLMFFDFVHYLKGDLSNADLIMCDGIENIAGLPGLKLDGIKVRSEAAKQLNLPLDLIPNETRLPVSFEQIERDEDTLDLVAHTIHEADGDYEHLIAYLSDLHLLHRFSANHCETHEDRQYVLRTICQTIKKDTSRICLIGGDVSSDFPVFQSFVSYLAAYRNPERFIDTRYFFTIGNHELWSFPDNKLDETIEKYRSVLQENGMYLVQNNLFYYSCLSSKSEPDWREISAEELKTISDKELREKTKGAFLIVFGGMGFAGNNTTFNANQGIYRSAVNREQEIRECEKFNELHRKVSRALYDKNVIVFTHMPIDDWLLDQKTTDRFVYVNGHRHINKYFDDGIKRIYSDNQIGYKRKEVALKHFSINMDYDWFSDYPDGIHEITAEDYRLFYRGINQGIDFNRDFSKIYMLKREQTFMFVAEKENGKRFLLMGGHIKTLDTSSLEYYYEKMLNYSESVRLFISDYLSYQKRVSEEIKRIGGEGHIHGCIVDIDFFNHLYINPLDGKITPYNALTMVDKILYKNLPSLLKAQRPNLYLNYAKAIQGDSGNQPLPILRKNNQVSDKTVYEPSTEMYRASRVLKKLQTLVEKKVIQIWNDEMAGTPSKEIGKTITQGLLESVADKK